MIGHTVINNFVFVSVTFVFVQIFSKCAAIVNGGSFTGDLLAPRFLSRGSIFKVVTGDTVILPCEVQNLGSFVLVWRRGTTLLSAGQQMITRDPRISLMGYNLQLRDVKHPDQGDYTCQIGDGTPGDLIHTIETLMPPAIQMMPSNGQVTARKGGSTSFECRATGNPVPEVRWSKKDGLLPSGMQVENGYLLTLTDIQRQHAGAYQCIAENGIGQPITADVKLHVLYPPEINVIRSWVTTGEGLEAKLDCIVYADPPAEVLWYQDSFNLEATDRRLMSSSGKTHTLVIKNIQLSDFGNYSCVVVNSIGKDKKFIELSGRPGPPVITSPGYTNSHHYRLMWSVQSVFPINEAKILFRRLMINSTYQHPGGWHDLIVIPEQISFNPSTSERTQLYNLNHLMPDSVYECLIQTKNQHGYGELSDIHQWFTSQKGRPFMYSNSGCKLKNCVFGVIILYIKIRIYC